MTAVDTVKDAFREVMASVATPVSVVTVLCDDQPYGTTVSAFASLSMDPPMILVSLDRGSETLALLHRTGRFGLNVLGVEQASTALCFAKKGGAEKFRDVGWEIDHELPRIDAAPGWVACTVAQLVDGGDHVIALGLVDAADLTSGKPLVYHGRTFGTHHPS
ncbi:flavin reductase family protein [Nocardia sp. NPDC004123]